MKKLLLSLSFLMLSSLTFAQNLIQQFYYQASTTATELLTTTSNSYSLAFNKSNGKLYVANRGDEIYIIANPDSFTGTISSIDKASLPKLTKGTIAETNRFSKVRVDDDGVIYATAMQTNGTIYIYRWANETATPTRTTLTDAPTNARVGDSFGLWGTGDNTRLYIAGNSSGTSTGSLLFVVNVVGGVPSYHGAIDLDNAKFNTNFRDIAKGSISPESESVLWLGSTEGGVTFRRVKIDLSTNMYVSHEVISTTYANSNCPVGEFINYKGQGYFVAASGRTIAAQNLVQLSKTGVVGASTVSMATGTTYNFSKTTYTTNSGYADIAYKKNTDNTMTFYVLTSQNYLGAVKTVAPLPVTLTSFNAAVKSGRSTLTWQTASENNAKGFEILSSTDGKVFTKAGYVASKATNGTTTTSNSYSFVDNNAKIGYNYYKLKQLDLDGKEELFDKVVSTNLTLDDAGFSVYPNPVKSTITVNAGILDFKGVKYELFDAVGKKILSENSTGASQQIALHHLSSSIYYLKISKHNVHQKTIKLIKQ